MSGTYPELAELLPLLRLHGVKLYRDTEGMTHIEFFEPQGLAAPRDTSPTLPPSLALMAEDDSGKCHCGHQMTSHGGEGFCLLGCDMEECAKGVEVKKP